MSKEESVKKESILAIVAHPDDIDIVSGGTIRKWIQEGNDVHYCIVSDGDAGSPDPDMTASEIAILRRHEQNNAAEVLGVESVHFLGLPDGQLQPSLELRMQITQYIRIYKPNKILTHSPIYNLQSIRFSHPDHLAVGQAVIAAVFPDARNPHAFENVDYIKNLAPHSVDEIWLMGAPEHSVFIDISENINSKISAIKCHESQLGDYGDINDFFVTWGRELAIEAGYPDSKLAEAFFVINAR